MKMTKNDFDLLKQLYKFTQYPNLKSKKVSYVFKFGEGYPFVIFKNNTITVHGLEGDNPYEKLTSYKRFTSPKYAFSNAIALLGGEKFLEPDNFNPATYRNANK